MTTKSVLQLVGRHQWLDQAGEFYLVKVHPPLSVHTTVSVSEDCKVRCKTATQRPQADMCPHSVGTFARSRVRKLILDHEEQVICRMLRVTADRLERTKTSLLRNFPCRVQIKTLFQLPSSFTLRTTHTRHRAKANDSFTDGKLIDITTEIDFPTQGWVLQARSFTSKFFIAIQHHSHATLDCICI
jgi:hypothetical protein